MGQIEQWSAWPKVPGMATPVLLAVVGAAVALAMLWPRQGAWARWRRARELAQRSLIEDALKHVHARELRGVLATPESLAGSLGIRLSRAVGLIATIEARGLVRTTGVGLTLTPAGSDIALRVIRAHRLLERYLADELQMPLEAIHGTADRREHELTSAEAAELEAQLGYPQRDPHGDPIPRRDGWLPRVEAVALTERPTGGRAEIVHIEDEPPEVFRQIVAAGLEPGMRVEVLEVTGQHVVVWDGERERVLAPIAAGNVFVAPLHQPVEVLARLSALTRGQVGRVVALRCEGLTRRRLLDLGLTPGAVVECAFPAVFGDPLAYRVRGALIALRAEQASQIEIERVDGGATKDEP